MNGLQTLRLSLYILRYRRLSLYIKLFVFLQLYGTVGISNVRSSADCAQHFFTHAKAYDTVEQFPSQVRTFVLVVTYVYGTECCNEICLFECFKTMAQFKSNLICRWFAPSLYAIRCFAWKSSPSVLHCRVQFFLHCWCRTLSGSKISNIACA